MNPLNRSQALPLIRRALDEDGASHDLTSRAVLPSTLRIRTRIIAKAPGVLAGGPVALWTFQAMDRSLHCAMKAKDGAGLATGQTILTVEGRARTIFAAERVALNLLGHLSGIATLTRQFIERVHGTRAAVYDTRKTLPGLRALEKYAVRVGGGQSHRASLAEAVLIKTNHVRTLVGQGTGDRGQGERKKVIQQLILKARQKSQAKIVEIEVTNFLEFQTALSVTPDIILLDNWSLTEIRNAVAVRSRAPRPSPPATLLEVSGGVTLANVRAIAKTGVDRISIGRLTHSAPALDVALHVMARVRTQ